jgi:hypothetical protein
LERLGSDPGAAICVPSSFTDLKQLSTVEAGVATLRRTDFLHGLERTPTSPRSNPRNDWRALTEFEPNTRGRDCGAEISAQLDLAARFLV